MVKWWLVVWLVLGAGSAMAQPWMDQYLVANGLHPASHQTILSIAPTSCSVVQTAGAQCEAVSVSMSEGPPFNGTQTVVAAGGSCNSSYSSYFTFAGNVLEATSNITSLAVGGPYTVCNQVAQAGVNTKWFPISVSVVAPSGGSSLVTAVVGGPCAASGTVSTLSCPISGLITGQFVTLTGAWFDAANPTISAVSTLGNAVSTVQNCVDANSNGSFILKMPVTVPGSDTINITFSSGVQYPDLRATAFTISPGFQDGGIDYSNCSPTLSGVDLFIGGTALPPSGGAGDLIVSVANQDSTNLSAIGIGQNVIGDDAGANFWASWQQNLLSGSVDQEYIYSGGVSPTPSAVVMAEKLTPIGTQPLTAVLNPASYVNNTCPSAGTVSTAYGLGGNGGAINWSLSGASLDPTLSLSASTGPEVAVSASSSAAVCGNQYSSLVGASQGTSTSTATLTSSYNVQQIVGTSLSNSSVAAGSPTGTAIGTFSTTLNPSTPAFSGGWSLSTSTTNSGGCNSSNSTNNSYFSVVGSSLLTGSTLPSGPGNYLICVAAVQSGLGGSPFGTPFQITVYTAAAGDNVVINPNNPSSQLSVVEGSYTYAFHATDGCGDFSCDWPLYSNGAKITASDGTNLFYQGKTCNGAFYAYNISNTTWYGGSGTSFSPVPAVNGGIPGFSPCLEVGTNSTPFYIGAGEGTCTTDTCNGPQLNRNFDEYGRQPDGPTTYYPPCSFWGPCSTSNPSPGYYAQFLSYDFNTCLLNGSPVDCTANNLYYPDFAGLAAGNYNSSIAGQLTTYLKPWAPYITEIDLNHEWTGCGWYNWQYCNTDQTDWAAGTIQLAKIIQNTLINCGVSNGCNQNIRINTDAPDSGYVQSVAGGYFTTVASAGVLQETGTDSYLGPETGCGTSAQCWAGWTNNSFYGYSWGLIITYAENYQLSLSVPETCSQTNTVDSSFPANGQDYIWQAFANLFYSIQGNSTGFVTMSPWNGFNDGGDCNTDDFSFRLGAWALPAPNGFYGNGGSSPWYYGGTGWPSTIGHYWIQNGGPFNGGLIPNAGFN